MIIFRGIRERKISNILALDDKNDKFYWMISLSLEVIFALPFFFFLI